MTVFWPSPAAVTSPFGGGFLRELRVGAGAASADWLKMLWRRVSRVARPTSFGLGSSLCALGVGTWPRADRGRVTGTGASGIDSGAGVVVFEDLSGWAEAAGGLAAFGATDSRRGRDEAAVTVNWDGVGFGSAVEATGVFIGSVGDIRPGVGCRLGRLEADLLTLGVLGPAGASGTWTVFPFVKTLVPSGRGTGVFATGEGTSDAGNSLGVETAEAGVAVGDVKELGAGAMSCNLARFASGGLVALSCVATEASRVAVVPSVVTGGDASRFRLLDVRVVGRFFWLVGVANVSSLKPLAASFIFSVASTSSWASRIAC